MIVIKVGGGAGVDVENVLDDLANLDEEWVLVHGASDETNRLQEALGHPARFVTSVSGHVSRLTDDETLQCLNMGAAKLNLRIVEGLQKRGVNAVGLTGVDGRLLEGKRKDAIKAVVDGKRVVIRGDRTGTIERVNVDLLRLLLGGAYRPVVTVPTISHEGEAVNADGDRAAAAIAGALGARALLILSNVPGLLRDVDDPTSLVSRVPVAELDRAAQYAKGRFGKKILGAREALDLGVARVVFSGTERAGCVRAAVTGEAGTHVYAPGGEPPVASAAPAT